ncbi:MAG: NAD(P)H-dependent amine dehydrogenase family protein [Candidatus Thorarchaeota archaeon]|nr:MAG: dihydrodipicolinate reductase [Candidatus Thorarchaeota archaeon]
MAPKGKSPDPQPFRVLQIGLGSLGRHIAVSILKRENLSLVAVVDADPDLTDMPLTKLLPEDVRCDLFVSGGLTEVLDRTQADVAVIATSSSLQSVAPTINSCLEHGLDVVSICEELSFPFKKNPKIAEDLDRVARAHGKTVTGTGINPGYLMDLLPLVLTGPCQTVERIRVTRHMNSSHRRPSFQKKIGTGMTPAEFRANIDEGKITGHVGLVESIQMIDDTMNLGLDEIVELPPQPIIAERKVANSFTTVEAGNVLGLKSVGVGRRDGEDIITLDFQAYADATPQYDEIVIDGTPSIHQRIEGGVHGDKATIGMMLNMIPLVVTAPPGFSTMKDLPAPRNTERVWKSV